MAAPVPTPACCPSLFVAAPGSSAGSSGEGSPQVQVLPTRAPRWMTCWHGESCPWHAQQRCFWRHAHPAPVKPLVSGPTACPLAASVAVLEEKALASAAEFGALAAEVSVLDVKVCKALASEVLDLELKASSRDSQLQALVADLKAYFNLELGFLRDRLAGNASDVHGLASASSTRDGQLRAALALVEEKAEQHAFDLRRQCSDMSSDLACIRDLLARTGTCSDHVLDKDLGSNECGLHTNVLALPGRLAGKDAHPKASSGLPSFSQPEEQLQIISDGDPPNSSECEGSLRHADQSSSCADDAGAGGFHVGGCGFHGGGGGDGVAGMDELAPPSVPNCLSHAEIARRFALLPASVQGSDSAAVMAAILSM